MGRQTHVSATTNCLVRTATHATRDKVEPARVRTTGGTKTSRCPKRAGANQGLRQCLAQTGDGMRAGNNT
eukprot:6800429-Alexandrium_andersonii.AAC.1